MDISINEELEAKFREKAIKKELILSEVISNEKNKTDLGRI